MKPRRDGFYLTTQKREIDWNRVDALLEAGCTAQEIAADQGVGIHAFYGACELSKGVKWSFYKATKRELGKAKLREAQQKRAINGSDSMLKWLGEFRLNQVSNNGGGSGGAKITVVIKHFTVDSEGTQREVVKSDSTLSPEVASTDTRYTQYEDKIYSGESAFDEENEKTSTRLQELDMCHDDTIPDGSVRPRGYVS